MTPAPSMRERKKQRTRAAITQAALELFAARGFEAVTLTEVAEAADVAPRTLFRYFADKEELLFGDDEAVQAHLCAALSAQPEHEPPATALLESVVSLASLWQAARDQGRTRRAVIASSTALRARERAKHAAYEQVLLDGLTVRGTDRSQARLLARVTVACTDEAITRWLSDDDPTRPGLEGRMRETFAELAASLGTHDLSSG